VELASFDRAQDNPFDFAQDNPFDFAQGRPFDFAQGRLRQAQDAAQGASGATKGKTG